MNSFVKKLSTTTAFVSAGIGLTGVGLVAGMAGADASECVDSDGDGWGWDGSQSCDMRADSQQVENEEGVVVPQQADDSGQQKQGGSSDCVDSDGDGWGWDGSATCDPGSTKADNERAPAEKSSRQAENQQPARENDEPVQEKLAPAQQEVAVVIPAGADPGSECVDSDGDGWGWDGSQSCEAECVDDDGDGWGWDGDNTCIPNQARTSFNPSTNRFSSLNFKRSIQSRSNVGQVDNMVAAAFVPNDNAQLANTDIPRTSAALPGCEDPDGDGWGWDGSQSCATDGAPPVAAAKRGPMTTEQEACGETPWEEIAYDDLIIQHNVWNDSAMYDRNFELCTRLVNEGGEPVAQWEYDFLDRDSGNEYEVKAYPQVYYGKKIGASESGPAASLGLPAPVDQLDDFDVTYEYSEKGKGERNVALESFFYDDCTISEGGMDYEMMVWVGTPDERWGGSDKIGEANVDGADWDLYTNEKLPWNYLSYVAQEPSTSGTVDWNEFVEFTQNEAPKMGAPKLDSDKCMNGIELGTEIFWGEGEFTLHEFDVSRNGN